MQRHPDPAKSPPEPIPSHEKPTPGQPAASREGRLAITAQEASGLNSLAASQKERTSHDDSQAGEAKKTSASHQEEKAQDTSQEGKSMQKAASHEEKPANKPERESTPASPTPRPAPSPSIRKISLKIHEGPGPRKKAEEAARDEAGPIKQAIYTRDEFMEVWMRLATTYKEESLALFMAMTRQSPSLLKGHRVLVKLDNAIQEDLIMEKMPEILAALHKDLGNNLIRIETSIEVLNAKQKAYLPKEKLEALIKKNPSIKTLKDALDLDLDY